MKKLVIIAALLLSGPVHAGECYGDMIKRVSNHYIDLAGKGRFWHVTLGTTRGWLPGDFVILCPHHIHNERLNDNVLVSPW